MMKTQLRCLLRAEACTAYAAAAACMKILSLWRNLQSFCQSLGQYLTYLHEKRPDGSQRARSNDKVVSARHGIDNRM